MTSPAGRPARSPLVFHPSHALHARGTGEPSDDFSWRSTGPIDWEAVFRELIASECRFGRLTRARRRRILQYGAQLGLSPLELGEVVERAEREAEDARCAFRQASLHLVDHPDAVPSKFAWVCIAGGALLMILGFWLV